MTRDRAEQDQRLSWAFERERRRLLAFIRKRIPDEIDAEDLLQDVFYELVEAYRMMKPVAHVGAWMMQVAKNRIADLFRRGKKQVVEDGSGRILEDLLPSPDAGPDALYARGVLLAEIEAALGELPPSQRQVFLAHEIDGRSFAGRGEAGRRGEAGQPELAPFHAVEKGAIGSVPLFAFPGSRCGRPARRHWRPNLRSISSTNVTGPSGAAAYVARRSCCHCRISSGWRSASRHHPAPPRSCQ